MYDPVLIKIERAPATTSEHLWNRGHYVTHRGRSHGKDIAVLLAAGEAPWNQARRLRSSRLTVSGRTKFAQVGRVLAKLGQILHLCLVDRLHFSHDGRLIRIQLRAFDTRNRDGQDDEHDRN